MIISAEAEMILCIAWLKSMIDALAASETLFGGVFL